MESDTGNQKINEGFFSKHKHTLMMVLGCMIPLLLLGVLWVAGVSQNILSFGILLLCPIMHLLMMKNMKHGVQNPESRIDKNKKEELT
ncbi:MAG: hypothetical protein MPEBLZ_03415 [Candidatus Methanoperedens nitroreducens]|uniref:DUF2933 domain-containing protein n=1 Tax=Candidatus Methanoperedens nitratireducens TaxID=1392998 RepID=A0A0P8AD19_9EURY|nr:DUF2933 domain-containing protein [Candidatus Methanoperedens sp. BLZ2]KAB2940757.1 MAG: DUF2933 domain-containing protein [Candidatus Methanoperedens sp.]KPQ42028.1 MAG: hypothetical protein MPEBLZ_03415 [Candidatus Methanoperedens sp. BLZ1]MBZ0176257.1 DUF2933 domain-containing protein [Candidatus Methanoperedens nitroreducens]CAG0982272.1 hypothetical protein METP2_02048 [Methanosarcinales archaeon]MCX9077276.1 DUF2933 domain-containing protein [Candidatus Methanoperedens sp.]